jgi:hypothetical protein
MTSETLLLKLRAETLQSNLHQMTDCLERDPERRADLKTLSSTLDKARKPLNEIRKMMIDLEQVQVKEVKDSAEKIDAYLKEALDSFGASGEIVELMKSKCFSVKETSIGDDILKSVNSTATPVVEELNGIRSIVGPPPEPVETWKSLRSAGYDKTEATFTSFVELLVGAALRDTGLDEKIGHFADQLLGTANCKLLALPTGQQGPSQQTLARAFQGIIRVAFPEWTIWTLPAAALEYWKVSGLAEAEPTLKVNLASLPAKDRDSVQADHKEFLGDAYATYTMGPAYACYTIGLRLAPESEPDQLRACMALTMLEEMGNAANPASPPYADVSRLLLDSWNAARTQLGRQPLELASPAAGKDPIAASVRVLVRSLRRTLELTTSIKFGVEIWNEIHNQSDQKESWVTLLLREGGSRIKVPQGADLRHLLNAVWLARVSPERDPNSDLSTAVNTLVDEFRKMQERGKK